MPLLSFSIPEQVPLLLSGKKRQTTRKERKNPIKVGDTLYCYYRPRQVKSCRNCIVWDGCNHQEWCCGKTIGMFEEELHWRLLIKGRASEPCEHWNNYFGEAEVVHVRPFSLYKFILEKWAIDDGFENIDRAMDWLEKTHPSWEKHMDEFVVISFEPKWVTEA